MKRLTSGVLAGTAAAALAAALVQQPATAAMSGNAPSQTDRPAAAQQRPDNRPGPLTARQNQLRRAAVEALASGKVTKQATAGGGSSVKLGKGKYVEFFDNKKQANVLSILSEFGDTVVGRYGGTPGPLHNQILQPDGPDRAKDNSTYWVRDFNVGHYEEMFNGDGESFKNFYRTISGGQYTVDNSVRGWVKVPNNAAYYGANPREDEGGAWAFIQDTATAWFDAQQAAGKTDAEIKADLAKFDKWDRYDFDGDGNFNEPDGYIDHFQAIHAGEGEEAGASADAIWSHRWYVYTGYGTTGPLVTNNDGTVTQYKLGGAQIGDTGIFIGDYTVEPENGGLGVFAHEYGHDLGLPDLYDTAGGDNSTGFWTLMSSGSWLGHGDQGIGTTPAGMGPEERLFLGWLKHQTVKSGGKGTYTLSPAGTFAPAGGTTHAVRVNLPDKVEEHKYTTPPEGTNAWWSGRGDQMTSTLQRSVGPASRVTVSAAAWWRIEDGYDFLDAQYSTDGGQSWQTIGRSTTGTSRGWQSLSYSYRPGGQASLFRFIYRTDAYVNEPGAFLDTITVTADRSTFTDGVENGTNGWTADGWTISDGIDVQKTPRYYLLENRSYVGYDTTLAEGPYNFSMENGPNWVEFFDYQDGMLVWYVDTAYDDNNTSVHPGAGYALPVDARPAPFYYQDAAGNTYGKPSNRRQPLDATFGRSVESQCLHGSVTVGNGANATPVPVEACSPADGGINVFDDSDPSAYYRAANEWGSVIVAGVGVKATVVDQAPNLSVSVVNPAK